MLPTFIRLENSFEKATTIQGSPQDKFFSFEGVHLMSNPPFERGYIQRTYADDGIEIETVELFFIDLCGNELDAGEAAFNVLNSFNDPKTGLPQIDWELQPNGVDFGEQLIMLKIRTGANVYVYSSPFVLSDSGSEYTSFWAYRNKGQMMHIGLEAYRRRPASVQSLDNYTSTSGDIVAGISTLTKQEVWFTNVINLYFAEDLKTFSQCREVYSLPMFDEGLPQRTNFVEDIDSIEPQGDENFGQTEFIISRNEKYTYNPDSLPPAPPVPPEDPYAINLIDVSNLVPGKIRYNFSIDNFDSFYLLFEYSLDQTTWNSIAISGNYVEDTIYIVDVSLLNISTSYYYRISHPNAISNVKQLPQPSITIINVLKSSTNQFKVGYSTFNYMPTNPLKFLCSLDGINFQTAIYLDGNQNPKTISAPYSSGEIFFRIDSQDILLSSNVFKYEE